MCWLLVVLVITGLLHNMFAIDGECDIKKIVAYQTVVEMHAITVFLLLDVDVFSDVLLFTLPGHCWISTISFIVVDIIARRYHTRNIEHLYGIMAMSPIVVKIIFIVIFVLGSLPGTTLYSMEFIIQIHSSGNPFGFLIFILLQLIVAV